MDFKMCFNGNKNSFLKFILTLSLLNIMISFLSAQSIRQAAISGKVTDISTGQPLYFANVFLNNTTLGCATDDEGYYEIDNVPVGSYELVVSMMGYETEKKPVHLSKSAGAMIHFQLKPIVLKGKTVTVQADEPKLWRKQLEIFKKQFLGIKDFAQKCEILNPEVLDFTYDELNSKFSASAQLPLFIVNRSLGYKLTYYIREFWFNNITSISLGDVRFEELQPINEKEKKDWIKNRIRAYNGSKQHFIISACSNNLKKEGFKLRYSPSGIDEKRIKLDTIISGVTDPNERKLIFTGYLRVIYKNEEDEIMFAFRKTMLAKRAQKMSEEAIDEDMRTITRDCSEQESTLQIINGNEIILNTSGYFTKPSQVSITGYWIYEKIAEWVPLNYRPNH